MHIPLHGDRADLTGPALWSSCGLCRRMACSLGLKTAECGNGQGMAHLPCPMYPRSKHMRCWCTGTASPPALWTSALLVTPTFQLLYLHSWKIAIPMSFRAGPAVAKECHDRDGKEHVPVLLPQQQQGDTRLSHWTTLG